MSGPDVHNNKMDGTYDLDDTAVEALLRGHGDDPALSEALGSVRGFYAADAPALSPALASFIAIQSTVVEPLTRPESTGSSKARSMRTRFAARTAAVAATFVAATGGLAAAGALPGPVQRAVSHAASEVGVHWPEGSNGVPGAGDDGDPTNNHGTPGGRGTNGSNANNTPTSHPDNHGGEVSGVAHDDSQSGCDHGHAVAATASGQSDKQACPTTGGSTVPGDETHGNGKGAGHGSDAGGAGQPNGDANGSGSGAGNGNGGGDQTPTTPPTTAAPAVQGDGSHGNSGDHQPVNPNPHTSQNDGGSSGDNSNG
jgi:hypothetical protein